MRKIFKKISGVVTTYDEWKSIKKKNFIIFNFLSEFIFLATPSIFMLVFYRESEFKIYIIYLLVIASYSLFRSFYLHDYYKKHYLSTKDPIKKLSMQYLFIGACSIGLITSGVYLPNVSRMIQSNFLLFLVLIIWTIITGSVGSLVMSIVTNGITKRAS